MTRTQTWWAGFAAVLLIGLGIVGATGPAAAGPRTGIAPGGTVTVALAGRTATTTTTATVGPDGSYKVDFGISEFGDYTAKVTRSDGSVIATIPITVTSNPESCVVPTGAGSDWGVTHTPFPLNPTFPSYVTVCGRIVLAASTSPTTTTTTIARTPTVTEPAAASSNNDNENDNGGGDSSDHNDNGGGGGALGLILVVALVAGLVAVVIYLIVHALQKPPGSVYPDFDDGPDGPPGPEGPRGQEGPEGAGPEGAGPITLHPEWESDPPRIVETVVPEPVEKIGTPKDGPPPEPDVATDVEQPVLPPQQLEDPPRHDPDSPVA